MSARSSRVDFENGHIARNILYTALPMLVAQVLNLLRKVVMVVPLTYLLPYVFGLGTDGVFMAELISNLVGGLACFITMMITIYDRLKMKK